MGMGGSRADNSEDGMVFVLVSAAILGRMNDANANISFVLSGVLFDGV